MNDKGHQIDIICCRERKMGLLTQELTRKGITIHSIKPEIDDKGVVLTYSQHLRYIANAIRKAIEIIQTKNIDVIHANTYTPIIPSVILGTVSRIPVICTVHHVSLGQWSLWSSQKGIPRSMSIIGPICERLILRLPNQTMHVVSQATNKDLIQVNRKARVRQVYNGVDIQNDSCRFRYEKFLLYIGRLVSTKNLGIVILAFNQLTLSVPDAKLVIVGAGPMRCEWERLVSSRRLDKNIIFLGHVSENVKHDLLCSCCALILPSKLEGFGRVIIEAFAYSKPVLVSNLHSIKEIVDDGLDGFLVSPYDIDAWAEKMRDLLWDLDKCRIMGNNGRKKVERKFNLELVSDEIEKLYKKIVYEFSSN